MWTSISAGLRRAVRQPRLVSLLWAWSLATTLLAVVPVALWLRNGLSLRTRSEVLLDGFSFDVIKEIAQRDATPVMSLIGWQAAATAALAVLGAAFLNGGMLEVLWSGTAAIRGHHGPAPAEPAPLVTEPLMVRFARGAATWFWPNLRAMLLTVVVAALGAAGLMAILLPILDVLEDTQSTWLAWVPVLLPAVLLALVVWVGATVLDFARLRMVAARSRGAARAWFWALAFVARHPVSTLGMWGGFALVALVLATAGAMLVPFVPTHTWAGILGVILVQQVVVVARAVLRIGLLGAEVAYAAPRRVAPPVWAERPVVFGEPAFRVPEPAEPPRELTVDEFRREPEKPSELQPVPAASEPATEGQPDLVINGTDERRARGGTD